MVFFPAKDNLCWKHFLLPLPTSDSPNVTHEVELHFSTGNIFDCSAFKNRHLLPSLRDEVDLDVKKFVCCG